MEAFQQSVLLDMLLLTVVALLVAIPVYWAHRKAYPDLRCNYEGLVDTTVLNKVDLLGLAIIVPLMSAGVILSMLKPELSGAGKIEGIDPFTLSISAVMEKMIPIGLIAVILIGRTNLSQFMGMARFHWAKVLVWGVGSYVALLIFFKVLDALSFFTAYEAWMAERLGKPQLQEVVKMILETRDFKLLAALGFIAVIVAPITEEIVFRGYIYSATKRFTDRYFAAIFSGVLFGVIHNSLWQALPLSVLGILLALVYEKSGSIWAPIILHMLFNGVNVYAMVFHPELVAQ